MKSDFKRQLATMSQRAVALCKLSPGGMTGLDYEGRQVALDAFFKELLEAGPDAEKDAAEKYIEAWDAKRAGDLSKERALCEVRKIQINNYIRATSNWAQFYFDTVTLGNEDSAEFVNETNNEVSVGYLSQDGKPRLQRAIAEQEHFLVPLRDVASDKFGYQMEDIQRGNIATAAQRTVDISFDLKNKLDKNCRTLMNAALASGGLYGAFVTTGALHLRTYNAHSDIITSNLPTTNDLVTPGNSTSTKFRLDTIRTIIAYYDQWKGVFPDGDPAPSGAILIASKDAGDLLDELSATDAKVSEIGEGLLKNYTRIEFGGYVWTVIPDPTLDPADGYCYPVPTKTIGSQFRKPTRDKERVKTDEDANWEERWMKACQGLYIPVQRRVNACRVRYRTPA